MNGQIEELTPEEEELLSVYRVKWRNIALSTERIDRVAATGAIETAYNFLGLEKPEIVFCDSPYFASIEIDKRAKGLFSNSLLSRIRLSSPKWDEHLWNKLLAIHFLICSAIEEKLEDKWILIPEEYEPHYLQTDILCTEASSLDFYISELNYEPNLRQWEIYRSILENCGWICAYDNICFVCDRPTKLSFDKRHRLHAEGKPAIKYADGFSIYTHHGISLPEKYGKFNPNKLDAKRLLEGNNIELKKLLNQGVSYIQPCPKFPVINLNYWQKNPIDLDFALYN